MHALVMSHWSPPGGFTERNLLFWRLAHALAIRHHGGVHLITDTPGASSLSCLGWLSVDTSLDELGEEQSNIWSLGKIMAYGVAARRFGSFAHIDGDVFLWRPLPGHLLNAAAFAQHPEGVQHFYDLRSLDILPVSHPATFRRPATVPNMGITGGTDSSFWIRYSDECLDWVRQPANRAVWNQHRLWWGAILAEQWFMGAFAEDAGADIAYLFGGVPSDSDAEQARFTHLLGAKSLPDIAERVRRRLASNPPNLDPVLSVDIGVTA